MSEPSRPIPLPDEVDERMQAFLHREWLIPNGLGGYASGTLAGVPTRRYHGLLVASLPNPLGRTVMLTELAESLRLPDGAEHRLGGEELVGREPHLPGVEHLAGFHLELGLPVWRYEVGGAVVEKRVLMPYQQNTVHVSYRLLSGEGPVRLTLRPAVSFRPQELPVSTPLRGPYVLTALDERLELGLDPYLPPLRLRMHAQAGAFAIVGQRITERLYRVEESRGYDSAGDLWSPGHFRADLWPGQEATLIASTEPWEVVLALSPEHARAAEQERRRRLLELAPEVARAGPAAELVLAADAFIVTPGYRADDVARVRAAGDEMRTVIAGYHWFTDWGRDTMISLEGLALSTGRHREAGSILRTFAQYTRDGLIPNMFPDGSNEGLYHTADASLWFFHAADRYLEATADHSTLRQILPTLRSIVEHHLRGTHFGIHIDPADGLMTQGAEGYQLTWMDAKVEGWVVTPRRGKAVELNALWYNALRLLEGWLREVGDEESARAIGEHAERAQLSFNQRFWFTEGGYLYDVIDSEQGDDPACRPNQIFSISLRHPVLAPARWKVVLEVVRDCLLTPVGLRSLSPGHPDYRSTYHGDLRTRDAAYHQGTVWGWLIGPFVDAWLRVNPDDRAGARRFLEGPIAHLDEFGIGSIAEIFDAEPPFTPRGCIAQAWSVAEVLRAWMKTDPAPESAITPSSEVDS
jgi:predicted glycogen debranching enzyme